jgi:hypothetical protein
MNEDFSNDPAAYFRDLQRAAREEDRSKLATLVVEFGRTLQQLPKLQQEMDGILTSEQPLDYVDLVVSIKPKLEQAAQFLFDAAQLPAELQTAEEVTDFIQSAKANMTLQTIALLTNKFPTTCSLAAKRIAHENSVWGRLGNRIQHGLRAAPATTSDQPKSKPDSEYERGIGRWLHDRFRKNTH